MNEVTSLIWTLIAVAIAGIGVVTAVGAAIWLRLGWVLIELIRQGEPTVEYKVVPAPPLPCHFEPAVRTSDKDMFDPPDETIRGEAGRENGWDEGEGDGTGGMGHDDREVYKPWMSRE